VTAAELRSTQEGNSTVGILDRLSRLLRANVHAAIDKAEDPEKMLDQLVRDTEAGRAAGQQKLVAVMTERNRIAAEAANEERIARKALNQAETAAKKGNDNLAREALRRRHDAIEATEVYAQQAEAQQLMVERLKTQLSHVDTKLRRMRQERDSLVARARIADAQSAFADASKQISIQNIESEFARMARQVRRQEAYAGASIEMYEDSLEGRLDALEDEEIEAQLASIKERLDILPEASPKSRMASIPADLCRDGFDT
jgi:phage shock protein A